MKTETFYFYDLVMINGIQGYVDFIGAEDIALINKNNTRSFFKLLDIKEVIMIKQAVLGFVGQGHDQDKSFTFNWVQEKHELLNN